MYAKTIVVIFFCGIIDAESRNKYHGPNVPRHCFSLVTNETNLGNNRSRSFSSFNKFVKGKGNFNQFNNEISLILLSKFDRSSQSNEIIPLFSNHVRGLAGILLHSAVAETNVELLKILIYIGADVNMSDRFGVTPLYKAIQQNNREIINILVKCGGNPNFSFKDLTLVHLAVLRDRLDVLQKLIKLGAKVDADDSLGKTPLYYALESNKTSITKYLISAGANINDRNDSGSSILHLAAAEGKAYVVQSLIDMGSKNDMHDGKARTPLYIAISYNNSGVVEELLKNGADKNNISEEGNSLLHTAVKEGEIHVVKQLMVLGANTSVVNSYGLTPLHIAIEKNKTDIIKALINNTSNKTSPMDVGFPLHFAIEHGTIETVQLLLELSAEKTVQNNNGLTPIVLSLFQNRSDVLSLLLGNLTSIPLELNYNVDANYNKPLHIAVINNNINAAEGLLRYGARVNSYNKQKKTPLCLAVEANNKPMMLLLVRNKADLDFKTDSGDSLLHIAAMKGSLSAIEVLIELGLNVNALNKLSQTPLYHAVTRNNSEMIKLLTTKEATIDLKHRKGEKMLLRAVANSTSTTVKTFFKQGAELNSTKVFSLIENAVECNRPDILKILVSKGIPFTPKGKSLLHLAAEHGSVDVIQLLLEMGIPIDESSNYNYTPLWSATISNKLEAMRALIANGADIQWKTVTPISARTDDSKSWTLLHQAVYRNLLNASSLLLDHGFDPNPKDFRAWTPLHYAAISNKVDLAKLLVSRGAEVNARTKNGITALDLINYSNEAGREPMIKLLKSYVNNATTEELKLENNDKNPRNSHPPPFVAI